MRRPSRKATTLGQGRRRLVGAHDERARLLSHDRVRHGHHRDLDDGRMLEQEILHLLALMFSPPRMGMSLVRPPMAR
jgi:hypothetical protein